MVVIVSLFKENYYRYYNNNYLFEDDDNDLFLMILIMKTKKKHKKRNDKNTYNQEFINIINNLTISDQLQIYAINENRKYEMFEHCLNNEK
jgi:hypothetical protein